MRLLVLGLFLLLPMGAVAENPFLCVADYEKFASVPDSTPVNATFAEFPDYSEYSGVLIFTQEDCPPCLADQRERAKWVFQDPAWFDVWRHIDVNDEESTAVYYKVTQTPTYIVVSNGKPIRRHVGRIPKMEEMAKFIDSNWKGGSAQSAVPCPCPFGGTCPCPAGSCPCPDCPKHGDHGHIHGTNGEHLEFGPERVVVPHSTAKSSPKSSGARTYPNFTIGGRFARSMSRDALASHMRGAHGKNPGSMSANEIGWWLYNDHQKSGWGNGAHRGSRSSYVSSSKSRSRSSCPSGNCPTRRSSGRRKVFGIF